MGRFMVERQLYDPLMKGAAKDRWFLLRIADGSPGKKPFDIFGSASNCISVGLEVKLVKHARDSDPFPYQRFEEHQLAYLRQYAVRGLYSLAGLYDAETHRMKILIMQPRHFNVVSTISDIPSITLRLENESYRGWDEVLRYRYVPAKV